MAKIWISTPVQSRGGTAGAVFWALMIIGLMCMAYTAVLIGFLFVAMCVCAFVGTRLAIKARNQRRGQDDDNQSG